MPLTTTCPRCPTLRRPRAKALVAWAVITLAALTPSAPCLAQDAARAPIDEHALGLPELVRVDGDVQHALPVLETSIELSVRGPFVIARSTQRFVNPHDEPIEARYLFPIQAGASVDAMELAIGSRRIVAEVREKEAARRDYAAAKANGQKAALVENRRADLIRVAVANVLPGETVDIHVTTLSDIALDDGAYRLAIPLTYTPRYEEAQTARAAKEDPIEARFAPATSSAVPRVRLSVRIEAGLAIEDPVSPSHAIRVRYDGAATLVEPADALLPADRDFVLTWRPRFANEAAGTLWHGVHDGRRYGVVQVAPPDLALSPEAALPTATVFVLDRSGSMDGPSIRVARDAIAQALARQTPADSFTIVTFDDQVESFSSALRTADPRTIREALDYIAAVDARGGTVLAPAIERALSIATDATAAPSDARLTRIVVLTDGAIGSEEAALASLGARAGDVRLHAIGIGHAPHRALLRRLAERGRGLAAFVAEGENGAFDLARFLERIDRPVLTAIALEGVALAPGDAFPAPIPDLHAGEPAVIALRFADARAPETITLEGETGSARVTVPLELVEIEDAEVARVIARRFAMARVRALQDAMDLGGDADTLRASIIETALAHRIVTPYTSFVAIEKTPSNARDARTVDVPNGTPLGMLPATGTLWPLARRIALVLFPVGLALVALSALFPRWRM